MIEINQLQVQRNGNSICEIEHFAVEAGQRLAVVGSNGSGKTTLLRVLAGLITDYAGSCKINVGHLQRTYVHQHPLLFRGTVLSNVRYGLRGRAGGGKLATEWLDRLGVGALAQRSPQNLSGGETRRIALARALACEPQLLILDEPLADLDTQATLTVCQVLNDLKNTTVVITSPIELPTELNSRRFDLLTPARPMYPGRPAEARL